ncbi:MAG: NUDIX domain-containing protein [Caldilineaceae bacterium]|nr:NUDIX domain-containing protein [Caldilineaceae bacterium]
MSDGAQTTIHKVTALITCRWAEEDYLLLFQHPFAGIQLPAGTVEAGEDVAIAARREAWEESGLTDLGPGVYLGHREEALPTGIVLMAETAIAYSRPDSTSFNWATIRNGIAVRVEREEAGFTQVTFEEWDRMDDPRYVSFRITGWVPTHTLCQRPVRHFFHFEVNADPSQRWTVETDHHRFQLFWAPLSALPQIVSPQADWPSMLSPRFPNL